MLVCDDKALRDHDLHPVLHAVFALSMQALLALIVIESLLLR